MSDSLQPMNRSMPDLPVHHQLPEITQTRLASPYFPGHSQSGS